MVADLRKMQENQWFSENRTDKPEFTDQMISTSAAHKLTRS